MNGSKKLRITDWKGKAEMFAKLAWTEDVMFKIGIAEATIAILFLIPRTAFVVAILLAAYLGGATATHVRLGEALYIPILVAVAAWVALGLRQPKIFELTFGLKSSRSNDTTKKVSNSKEVTP